MLERCISGAHAPFSSSFPKQFLTTVIVMASLMFWNCGGDTPTSSEPVDDPEDISVVPPKIGWISLAPRQELPTSLDAPPEAGWPDPGQEIRWQAHVFNYGDHNVPGARYTWQIDGNAVEQDILDFPPGETIVELARPWSFTREEISFTVDMDTAEGVTVSDELTIISDALTIGLWVEQEIYDWMAEEPDVPRFEMWAREEVEDWNISLGHGTGILPELAGAGIFPNELIDHVRLDRVVVLPTGSPYPRDLGTDLRWYFSQRVQYRRTLRVDSPPEVVENQTWVLHELLHQRGLVDLYAYEVLHGTVNGSEVRILDPDGNEAAGTERMPSLANESPGFLLYRPNFAGTLMGWNYGPFSALSDHSIYGLNLFAKRRTPLSVDQHANIINPLAFENPYTTHVPDRIELLLSHPGGEPLSGVAVDVFIDHGEHTYQDVYAAEPDLTLQTDASGMAVLPSDLWEDPTWKKRREPNVLILRARSVDNTAWGYAFLPSYDINLAFIQGDGTSAAIPVSVELR